MRAMTWIEAWSEAARATWPSNPPAGVIHLHRIVDHDLPFTAPECPQRPMKKAWVVYEAEGDTPVGRAAVALAYAIAADMRRAP